MKKKVNIAEIFPKHIFWEYDRKKLDIDFDKNIIIPRALYYTKEDSFEQDISKLEEYYSTDEIIYHLKNTKEKISNRVCRIVAERYSIPVFYRFSLNK